MKLSEVFNRALKLVGTNNTSDYICIIIKHEIPEAPVSDRNRAIDVIYERINGRKRPDTFATGDALEYWLKRRGIRGNTQQMRKYRKRWLKELVREFKSKGD